MVCYEVSRLSRCEWCGMLRWWERMSEIQFGKNVPKCYKDQRSKKRHHDGNEGV